MLTHVNRFALTLFVCFLVLSQPLLPCAGYAQEKKAKTKNKITKSKPTIVSRVELLPSTAPTIISPEDLELKINLYPCEGEQPGNVLGVSEQAGVGERVAGFARKLHESDPRTRACAARQLGYIGREASDADPYLIRLLANEQNRGVASNVEEALWKIGPGTTAKVSELIELVKDQDVYVRLYATFALGYYTPQFSDEKRVVFGLIAATKDQDIIVRWIALRGLSRLGPIARDAVPILIRFLHDEDKALRSTATIALGRMGADGLAAVPALMDCLYSAEDYPSYTQTAVALAHIGPVILPLLEKEIHTNHSLAVLQVLRFMGLAAAPLIIQALRMKDREVRKKALEITALLGPAAAPAVPLLIEALKDSDEKIRSAATDALESIGPAANAAVPALTVALGDKDVGVQCSAAHALGAIGPAAKSSAPDLLRLMRRPRRGGRKLPQLCAAEGLMKMSAKTKALVPASMKKEVADWRALFSSTSLFAPDKTQPKPKEKPKPNQIF